MSVATKTISARHSGIPKLGEFLKTHPFVEIEKGRSQAAIEFVQNGKVRRVWLGDPKVELRGLIETMDNNPLVCADEMSVPSPEGTLALIALAPLIRAGALVSSPILGFNFRADSKSVFNFLLTEGFVRRPQIAQASSSEAILSCKATCECSESSSTEIRDLFEEAYGRAFFVRLAKSFDQQSVRGKPHASVALEFDGNLLTVHVAADRNGKCGAAQVIHAMNVMAGFEESLGIPGKF